MTSKEKFMAEFELVKEQFSEEAIAYVEGLKEVDTKPAFTENGAKVLLWMRDNKNGYNNIFKAKDIAEGLFTNSRSVSGSMRKLITDGYVLKTGTNPSCYALTELGCSCEVSMSEEAES